MNMYLCFKDSNTNKKTEYEEWLTTQKDRREHLISTCENFNKEVSKPITSLMLVVEDYKLMFCFMPKVACTSWKSVVASLQVGNQYTFNDSGDLGKRFHNPGFLKNIGIKSLPAYNVDERKEILETYTKVIAVRDPLQRLLSGYRDKFLERLNPKGILKCSYCKSAGRHVIRQYRENASMQALTTGEYATETEFLKYVTRKNPIHNRHFKEYYQLCNPCAIKYDYIIKMESISIESPHLFNNVLNTSMEFPLSHVSNKSGTNEHSLNLTTELKTSITRKYGIDYKIFGYQLP